MKDGVCTKGFPKAFNDATRDDGDGYPVYRCVAVGVGCLRPWHEGDPTQTAGDCAMNPELWYEGPPPLQHHVRECVLGKRAVLTQPCAHRRRDDGRTVTKIVGDKPVTMNNRFVVPYNPALLRKYGAHVNVEVCASIK